MGRLFARNEACQCKNPMKWSFRVASLPILLNVMTLTDIAMNHTRLSDFPDELHLPVDRPEGPTARYLHTFAHELLN